MEDRAAKVATILKDCLFRNDEIVEEGKPPEGAVRVEGVLHTFALHPGRLKQHEAAIVEVLTGLPEQFYAHKGGGWSFLNLCMDAEGQQWGEHVNMEQLCVLAIATNHGRWQMPREMWKILPGQMPYVQFNLAKAEGPPSPTPEREG